MNREILVGKTIVKRIDFSPGIFAYEITNLDETQRIYIDTTHAQRFKYVINELAREEIPSP